LQQQPPMRRLPTTTEFFYKLVGIRISRAFGLDKRLRADDHIVKPAAPPLATALPCDKAWLFSLPLWACVAMAAAGVCLSFLQVRYVAPTDIRVAAMRAVIDSRRTNLGDPMPSIAAARRLRSEPRARIYKGTSGVGSSFIYPPLVALFYTPLVDLSPDAARARLARFNRMLFAAICVLLLAIARNAAGPLRWWEDLGILIAAAVFYPLLRAVELNQATLAITFLLGLVIVWLQGGQERLAAIPLAAALALKPHLVLILPLMVCHAPRTVAWTLGFDAVLFTASLVYAGVLNHVDYVVGVAPMLAAGYAFYPNHSWNGLFNRLYAEVPVQLFAVAPPRTAVRILSLLCEALTYGFALLLSWRWRGVRDRVPWVFGFAWLAATLASPLAWEHHYAPALYLFVLLYGAYRDERERRPGFLLFPVAISFVLMASYFEVRQVSGTGPRLLLSYVFYGGLLLGASYAALLSRAHPVQMRRDKTAEHRWIDPLRM
jgi:hypothetical protein